MSPNSGEHWNNAAERMTSHLRGLLSHANTNFTISRAPGLDVNAQTLLTDRLRRLLEPGFTPSMIHDHTNRAFALATSIIFALCFLCVLLKFGYHLFLSPLRNIPGPFLAKFTTKWLTIHEVLGHRSMLVEKAHQRYGPVVRLAPNELSFSDRSCIKDIYLQGSKFPKSRRYEGFASTTRASFDMTDKDEHRQRRNLVRHVLAQSNIDNAAPLIADQVCKSLAWVQRSEGGSLEIMLWMRRVMLDTAGALFLGRDFGGLVNEQPPAFLDDLDNYFNITALRWLAPWMLAVMSWIPVRACQHFLRAQIRCYEYGRRAFDDYVKQYGRFSGRIDLLTKMVGTKESAPLTDEAICNELGSLLVGATDTTVVVSTWMLWELAQRPEWQIRLRQELRDHHVKFPNGVPAYKDISMLSTLDGFIMEAMRLHPAQSIGLPRIARTNEASVGGIIVPAGTYVSIQSRSVHRDPEVFPDPAAFHPERWIDTHGGTKEMKDSFIMFSKGSRACLGQYVATMELKLIVASLVNGWDFKLAKETTKESMTQTDYFLAFPKDRACYLTFEKTID